MADQTNLGEAAHGAESPPGGEPWPRTKALTILTAAWAALGLLTVAVLLGSAAVSELLAEGRSDDHRLLIYWGLICVALPASTIAGVLLWSTIVPTPRDDEDDGPTNITPLAVRLPGLLLPSAICLLGEWSQYPADSPPSHIMAMGVMLAFEHFLINKRLGPLIRSRSPELWAEAVHRRHWRESLEGKRDDDRGFALLILSMLLFYFLVA